MPRHSRTVGVIPALFSLKELELSLKSWSSDSPEDCVLTLSRMEKGRHPLPVATELQTVF